MAHDDLAATSLLLRTTGPPTWLTRRGKLVGRRYGGASGRTADLARVRPNPQWSYDRPDTDKTDTLTCGRIPHRKDDGRGGGVRQHGKPQGSQRPTRVGILPPDPSSTIPAADFASRTLRYHPSGRAPTPSYSIKIGLLQAIRAPRSRAHLGFLRPPAVSTYYKVVVPARENRGETHHGEVAFSHALHKS
ncbi:hypothetical protein BHE74_00054454 [Ensete ventricosum]|nr:hypothetical protein BHE74_00054454 [Ensete ventricosum]